MTIELTPAQIQILERLVNNETSAADHAVQWRQRNDKRPAFLADAPLAAAKAKHAELETLRDLLQKSPSIIILHHA